MINAARQVGVNGVDQTAVWSWLGFINRALIGHVVMGHFSDWGVMATSGLALVVLQLG